MFSYPLIFLAKLVNDGLLRSDLTVIDAGSPLLPPTPMAPDDKLCRLFQLGADLLDAISPNPHHPAVRQAAFLRKVRDAGISGRRAITSAPSSPQVRAMGGGSEIPPIHPHALSQHLQRAAAERQGQPPAPAPPVFPSAMHRPPSFPSGGPGLSPHVPFSQVALSGSYAPTPSETPSMSHTPAAYPSHRALQAAGVLEGHSGAGGNAAAPVRDPFSALLSELNPSFVGSDDPLFGLDSGLDWSVLDGGGGDTLGANGFASMQF